MVAIVILAVVDRGTLSIAGRRRFRLFNLILAATSRCQTYPIGSGGRALLLKLRPIGRGTGTCGQIGAHTVRVQSLWNRLELGARLTES